MGHSMARFLVTTVGSLGDLHPMFPVVRGLHERGHTSVFIVPEVLASAVTTQGFTAHAVRMPDQPMSTDSATPSPSELRSRIRVSYGPYLEETIRALEAAAGQADAILSTPNSMATAIVGERRKLPWITLTVFPGLIPSSYTVPEPHWLPP